jgi:hypothetical protein
VAALAVVVAVGGGARRGSLVVESPGGWCIGALSAERLPASSK